MADDDARDERLGRLLEVEPLDEVARRRLVTHRDARVRRGHRSSARRLARRRRGRRRSWWPAASATSRYEGTTAPRRARAPQRPGDATAGRRSVRAGRLADSRGADVGCRSEAEPDAAAGVRGPVRPRRRRRSRRRHEPRPAPSLHRRVVRAANRAEAPGDPRARHSSRGCAHWPVRASCPTARSSRSVPGASATRDAIVVETTLPTARPRSTPWSRTPARSARSTEATPMRVISGTRRRGSVVVADWTTDAVDALEQAIGLVPRQDRRPRPESVAGRRLRVARRLLRAGRGVHARDRAVPGARRHRAATSGSPI